jgi:hypothetical protein
MVLTSQVIGIQLNAKVKQQKPMTEHDNRITRLFPYGVSMGALSTIPAVLKVQRYNLD